MKATATNAAVATASSFQNSSSRINTAITNAIVAKLVLVSLIQDQTIAVLLALTKDSLRLQAVIAAIPVVSMANTIYHLNYLIQFMSSATSN